MIVEEEIYYTLRRIKERITDNIKDKGLWASGKTAESMEIVMNDSGGMLLGRKDFESLEHGSPPFKAPDDFNETIKQWIIDKGLLKFSDKKLNSVSKKVAKKIEEQGTKLYRDGGRNDIYSDVIEEEVDDLFFRIFEEEEIEVLRKIN